MGAIFIEFFHLRCPIKYRKDEELELRFLCLLEAIYFFQSPLGRVFFLED